MDIGLSLDLSGMTGGEIVDTASGVLFLLLALVFFPHLRRRDRFQPINIAFLCFAGALGVYSIANNLVGHVPGNTMEQFVLLWVSAIGLGGAGFALFFLIGALDRPRGRENVGFVIVAGGVGIVFAGFSALVTSAFYEPYAEAYGVGPTTLVAFIAYDFAYTLFFAFNWSALIILGLWFRHYRAAGRAVSRQYAMMAGSLGMMAGVTGGNVLLADTAVDRIFGLTSLAALGVALAIWVANMFASRYTSFASWVFLACTCSTSLGIFMVLAAGGFAESLVYGGYGVVRVVAVLLLLYGILRHQVFDIEVKINARVAKTLVVSAALLLFYYSQQLAIFVFNAKLSPLVAVFLSALLLVLSHNRIDAFAKRLERRLLALTGGGKDYTRRKKEEAYRQAIRIALADRVVTLDEQKHLAALRESLDIEQDLADKWYREIEAQVLAGPRDPAAGPAREGAAEGGEPRPAGGEVG